jgi:hypothetical protein
MAPLWANSEVAANETDSPSSVDIRDSVFGFDMSDLLKIKGNRSKVSLSVGFVKA